MPPENSESGSKSKSAGGDITSNATTPQHVENSDLDSSFPFLAISSANQPDSHAETTIEAQQDEGDAQEVFQASLDFQNKQAPDPQVLDRRSSSSSLYPSLESVSQVGGENIEVELSWEAATISQKKKAGEKHKSQAAAANNSNLQLTELTQSTRDEEGIGVFEDGSRIGSIGNRINAHLRHLSVASSMGSQQDEYWMDETSSNALGAAARIPTCTAATEDDDMIAMKRAAYHGHDTDSTTHSLVARMPQHHQAEAIVVEDLHPSDIIGYAVQAEFVGQDYGAAMNHRTHQIENRPPATEASHVTSSEDSEVEVLATATADTTEVTEATVIESGPIEKATAEAWSVAPAAEAMVLQDGGSEDRVVDTDSKPPAIDHSQRRRDNDDGTRGNFSTAINGVQADQEAEATVVDYDIHPSAMTSDAVHAEFVGQDYNSTAGFSNSVEERFSATEASRVAATAHDVVNVEESGVEEATEATVIESGPIEKATAQAWSAAPAEEAQVLEENVATTIAEVDSKPHDTGDPEAWVTNDSNDDRFAMANGEAEVVGITEEPHPSEFTEEAAQAELIGADFNTAIAVPSMNHQEHSAGNTNEGLVEEATIVIHGESHAFVDVPSVPQIPPAEPQEAQATLINDEELTHLDQQGGSSVAQEAPSATAILEENYSNRNISSLTQLDATPVTVLEERNVEHSSASCFYDPVKPFAGQTTSYEATQVPTSPLENDPDGPAMSRDELAAMDVLNEPSWMNAPSLGGDNTDLPPPVVIPTPASPYATVNAEDQHVVVPPIPSPTEFAKTSPNTSRTEGRSDLSNSQSCGFQVVSNYLYALFFFSGV